MRPLKGKNGSPCRPKQPKCEHKPASASPQSVIAAELFARAFAVNPAAIAITRLDDGTILEVNEAWQTMFGYSRDDALGHFTISVHIWQTSKDRDQLIEELREKGSFHDRQQALQRKSGKVFVGLCSAEIITIAGAELILWTWQDLSDRNRELENLRSHQEELQVANEELATLEEDLRSQNERLSEAREEAERERLRYRDLFETAPDVYVVTDPQGTIQKCNQAATQMLDVPGEYLTGRKLSFFLLARGIEQYVEYLSHLNADEKPPMWEVRVSPIGKAPLWAAVTASASYGKSSEIIGIRWLIHDITDRKRAVSLANS